jgi:hypothetical protein
MRSPISASHHRSVRRCAPLFLGTLAVLACACTASLIDPAEPGLHYTLRDVAGHGLPVELMPELQLDGTAVQPWLIGGEVLLRPDSSALMVLALRRDSAGTRTDRRVEWPGTYAVGHGSIILSLCDGLRLPDRECLLPSYLLPFSEQELVFRHLTSFNADELHDYRFVRD